jgi:hypothetical protein
MREILLSNFHRFSLVCGSEEGISDSRLDARGSQGVLRWTTSFWTLLQWLCFDCVATVLELSATSRTGAGLYGTVIDCSLILEDQWE